VSVDSRGINVAVFSAHAAKIEICFFDEDGDRENARIALPERTGDIHHGHIGDIGQGHRYGLRAYGPFDPQHGYRFNPAKLLIDPYARRLDRPLKLDPSLFPDGKLENGNDLIADPTDSAAAVPKAIVTTEGQPGPARRRNVAWADTVLYELHVRGFTKTHPAIPPAIAGTFAGLAHTAAIDHLVALGITCVELMPAAAWIDERHLNKLRLTNYWGYNPIAFMVPDPRLAPGGWAEIRATVDRLHEAGIEVVLDVVLNHTGEGDECGPTLSFRGLDNASYYRLRSGDARRYVDDSGCGNCLALDRSPVIRFVMDVLRHWAIAAGIDGYRFDLATALGRREQGFDAAAPLLAAITQDPVLRQLKMIAEPWDIGFGGYQLGAFPSSWAEWNDRFRDDTRRFWRGDGTAGDLATRLAGSSDVFASRRPPSRSVNFIASHDGMTLADSVSFDHKHNEANGENNRDGTDNNLSWNCGSEGPSADPLMVAARRRDQCALLATLLLSRGTPMMAMGSEIGHSQSGNNNAYAQDNPISWLDWARVDTQLLAFARGLIAIRKAHRALRDDHWLIGAPIGASTIADVEWRDATGRMITDGAWRQADFRTLVAVLAVAADDGTLDRVAIVFHRGHDSAAVVLPPAQPGRVWQMLAESSTQSCTALSVPSGDDVTIGPRCVALFGEAAGEYAVRRRHGTEPALLDALAAAAGIAAEWWDIGGRHHVVGSETKRALLIAMGLAADSHGQIRDSLRAIADEYARPGLPQAWLGAADQPTELPLRSDRGLDPGPISIRIEGEDGGVDTVAIAAGAGRFETAKTVDGRVQDVRFVSLPVLPTGRHRIFRFDQPDLRCLLTIAPPRCYRPPALAHRQFGIAAQLYALRRFGDQGIGDFTTLGQLAEQASAAGAVTIALNPLHALFPFQRERASPYQPSDRRFLDPIYIDLDGLLFLPDCQSLEGAALAAERVDLSEQAQVDYSRVWRLKQAVLVARFTAFEEARAAQSVSPVVRDFERFVSAGGIALRQFACFEALCQTFASSGAPWPAALQACDPFEVAAFAVAHERDIRFYSFLQWLADRQLGEAVARMSNAPPGLGLYRDLALGAAPDGAEIWANRAHFMRGASIGAPPDPFSAQGQVWHLPPLNPLRLQSSGYASFCEPLRANMRHAGVLRIDHVLGLARLFCIPDGGDARAGTYVAFPIDDLVGQLKVESARNCCLVVGEDLGTVPPGLRDKLAQAEVLSYRVLWFEKDGTTFRLPQAYPGNAAACVSTHDLPTLYGWWVGQDISESKELGLLSSAAAAAAFAARQVEKQGLLDALQKAGLSPPVASVPAAMTPALAADIHGFVGMTASVLVIAQTDDLVGETRAVNLPGTDRERPNWRRKLAGTIEDLLQNAVAQPTLAKLRELRANRSKK
jgi:glycogen operon protein